MKIKILVVYQCSSGLQDMSQPPTPTYGQYELVYNLIVGIIVGYFYYVNMKKSIKDHYKNCSFVANKMTDILAFIVGFILIYYGLYKYKDHVLLTVGVAITTEHILQFSYKV